MSLPRYPEYKDSRVEWLRDVPTHWTVMPIRLAARLESGHTPSRNRPDWWEDCSVPWFTLADVSQIRRGGADVIYDTKEKVSELGLQNSSARRLPAGTVMLSRTASVGFSAIMGVEMATTQDFANWVCSSSLRPRFLLHVFRAMRGEFVRLMMGSTHNTIYMPDIAALRFALPPVEEQDAVVSFLDRETAKIDSLIAEQEKLIALLGEKRQATISHAVTKGLNPDAPMKDSGLAWLGEVPAHWELRSISSLSTKITNGYVGPTRDILVDDGVRYLQSLHIKSGCISFNVPYYVREEWSREHKKSILAVGDVLIVQTGDIGQVAAVSDEFAGCNCHALIIVSPVASVVAGDWLALVLNSNFGLHSLLSIQTGALHPHLNCGNVKDLYVPVPPLGEQQDIASFVRTQAAQLEALRREAERAVTLFKERRSALIAAAVTGQIDVRSVVPPTKNIREELTI
ncbi:type I restriction enzyme, S subunit [Aromatoleum tolulyticum]|uniref:Type I restriction enzyme, S subunit n=1 Tax=Aromatoleum tolulyticum TaxID=34027 RepID=A0A1N6N6M3_9RHOO|nr:restriction endonuclease subunit S [Aromatoleum tolulyticum]SIP87691.1 type I restriction enzyme, S subunit [Aromatoleum tolulyticum]